MTKPKPSQIPTDAVLAERRQRYGHHLPSFPLRRTRVPGLLADRPELAALDAERAAVQAAEARLSGEHADWQSRVQLARAEHQEAQRRAMLDGTEPPPPLVPEPWPYPEHTRATFDAIHAVIEATELGLLEDSARAYAADLAQEAAPSRAELDAARRRVAELEGYLVQFDRAHEILEQVASGRLSDDTAADVVEIPRVRYDPNASPASEAELLDALHPPRRRRPRR
ncbi:hypothetical protein [uncultured Nocardioides sp.]|uniref:hypothetical protein n=1 Tax=uncultured Nocardioides sp. TaxID=198441 RepID=UPI000C54C8E9|nr:hypothetical protein [uncultured Nocardioides sp.]MBS43823.1 hypothetical protein [Nocardioides sp.]